MASPPLPRRIPDVTAPEVDRVLRSDGSFVLRSAVPLAEHAPTVGTWLDRWANERPDQAFVAERDGTAWRLLSYAEAWHHARSIGQALVNRKLSIERPVAILSGNSIEHALIALGALLVGVPIVPVSVAYSTASANHTHLQHIMQLVTPGLVFVSHWGPFEKALSSVSLDGVEIVAGDDAAPAGRVTPLPALLATVPGSGFESAAASVDRDTVAKILMTSGSTERPKGVINTHGMLTANQQSLAQVWPFVDASPPVLVDWLPWSHTFGGNHNFNLVLRTGGTMYIDAGRPVPGMFEETVRNLREISPTIQFNVPAGLAMLVTALENDEDLAERFFERLEAVFYAAAALPQDTWRRLDAVAERNLRRRVWLTTAWGATETAPLATSAHFAADDAGNIGVPVPGVSLKFVPAHDKLELRVKGPNVTPGYFRDLARTRAAFDEEGYYRTGDAGRLALADVPNGGVLYDGRVAEDFKLSTGTWVNVGRLRTDVVSATQGLLRHAVIVGHGQDWVGLLGWLDIAIASRVTQTTRQVGELVKDASVHAALLSRLTAHNKRARGSSQRIARVMLIADPPSLDAGEITDKGYLNAAAVVRHRADAIAMLYDEGAAANVIVLG